MPTTKAAIERLKSHLVVMGEMGEHALATAIMALVDRNSDLACYVIDYDREIDNKELEVDRQCLELMRGNLEEEDLRFVAAAAKINNDLERVSDLAVEICEHVLFLVREKSVLSHVVDFQDLLEQVGMMMRESISALIEKDTKLAWKIIDERRIVENETQIIFHELVGIIQVDPRTTERCCHILFIVQCLMRVAAQAANIAEELIFTKEGVNVRHHLREFHPVSPAPFGNIDEAEQQKVETAILKKRKSRQQLRDEHAQAERASRRLTDQEVTAAAATVAAKAKAARLELLKRRSKARK